MEEFYLIKFGEKEHLEELKNGEMFFSSVKNYRGNLTEHRGDKYEGKRPIAPSTFEMYDESGKSLFESIPRPSVIMTVSENDDYVPLFCAAMINDKVLYYINNKQKKLKSEFLDATSKFGDYALIFNPIEIINRLVDARKREGNKWGSTTGPIIYRDLKDFSNQQEYKKSYNTTGSFYDTFFVKDKSYMWQNEWRAIVDGCDAPILTPNENHLKINIGKLDWSYLCKTQELSNFTIEKGE